MTGEIFNVGRKVAVTLKPSTISASPFAVHVKPALFIAASDSKLPACARQSRKFGCEVANVGQPRSTLLSQMRTSRSGSAKGSGRNITALTTLKIAVLAPTPSASVTAATRVKPGLFRSARPAYRRSCKRVEIM